MSKTIAAISTGNAPGGIGVIRISGSDAVSIADKVFECRDKSALSELAGYRAKFGNIVINGEKADNAVALVFRAPKSYTGEDVVELSVHGGLLMVKKTLEAVLKNGASPAGAGEFTKRAFLNGKIDLTQAESVAQLISAEGETSLKASFNALQGALSTKINSVLEKLLDASALMAAWVDYPDEEIPEITDGELSKTLKECKSELKILLDNYENGVIITQGVLTAIVGRVNVGKSSIMNVLAKKDKSIVTDIAGTTRDIVEEEINLGGITLRLMDTAGLRTSDDVVENIGIQKTYQALDEAQLILAIFDASTPFSDEDRELVKRCKDKPVIAIYNKSDCTRSLGNELAEDAFDNVVYVSAKFDEGFDKLERVVSKVLGVADFDSSAPMLANARQKQNCENAYASICEALDALQCGMTFDAVNVMIDAAADELLSLTGKKASEEVVNNIFSKFCVGK
ncbi:MAG: tRNA uridine-5-carboxymethylaminomethyl(34) synthesis GTPase MnmE [Eubacterium sp.]|nr:tRNA uridine-5-carboxymethylaminomethyl(34) synthesis GTPase MnmE [Eubacterium sp.]